MSLVSDFLSTLLSTRRTSRSRSKFLVVPLAGVNLGRDVLGGYGALATGGWVGWEALPSARAITSSTSSSAPCRSRATPLVGSRSPSKSNWDKVGGGTGYCLSKKGVQTLVWSERAHSGPPTKTLRHQSSAENREKSGGVWVTGG